MVNCVAGDGAGLGPGPMVTTDQLFSLVSQSTILQSITFHKTNKTQRIDFCQTQNMQEVWNVQANKELKSLLMRTKF